MSAIYQRARPIRWDQVVGQEHVKDVLQAALEAGRVGHAYLFSGPRGVGKTTTARLIAMTANCTGPAPHPCGECSSCLAVRAGNHPDVTEIDAASNNGVDDVRELREKVALSSMLGGKKIYILDEAHMMSRAAFNALLKTLEEPPAHVIFILATTEPEKILPTILSRCQHYRFRRLTPEEIAGKLERIATREGVDADSAALQLIGRLADGAMRDGESLLERMLAAGTAVTRPAVEAALGLPPGERVRGMAAALVLDDAAGVLGGAAALYRDGYAARTVVEGLVTALGEALHAELGMAAEGVGDLRLEGASVPLLLRLQAALDAQESRFARSADLGSLELALTHALLAGEGSPEGVAAPRTAAGAADPAVSQRLARLEKELATLRAGGLAATVAAGTSAPAPLSVADDLPAFDPARPRSSGSARAATPTPVPTAAEARGSWDDVVRLATIQTRAFLKTGHRHADAERVSLTYDDKWKFHAQQVIGKFDEIGALVLKVFGPVQFEIIGPTPDTTRRGRVGGAAGAGGQPSSQPSASPDPAPPFPEARAERANRITSATATPAEEQPSVPQTATLPHAPAPPVIPDFEPARRAPRVAVPVAPQAGAVQAAPAQVARVQTASVQPGRLPEVARPTPLPDPGPPAQTHVAESPHLPGTTFEQAAPGERPVYVEPLPIDAEPDWDDLGDPNWAGSGATSAAPPPREPIPREPAPRDDVVPAPVQAGIARPAPVQAAARLAERPASASPASPDPASPPPAALADVRGHPLFQQAARMWPGRVKDVGRRKLPVAEVTAEETDDGEL